MISDLNGSLGSRQFLNVANETTTTTTKGHVLHHARAHLKVRGCSLVWNALLTKKLPMFLLRCRFVSVCHVFKGYGQILTPLLMKSINKLFPGEKACQIREI